MTFDVEIAVIALGNIIPPGVKDTIKEKVMKTYKEALEHETDIYRLSEHVYRYYNKEWAKLRKKKRKSRPRRRFTFGRC